MKSHRSAKMVTEENDRELSEVSAGKAASHLEGIRKLKLETDRLKLLHRMKLEEELSNQRSVLLTLSNQIEEEKYRQRLQSRAKILHSIETIKVQASIRDKMQSYSNKEIERLKLLRELHEIDNEERQKQANLKRVEEEKRILEEKRKLALPLRLDQIKKHEEAYLKSKKRLPSLNPQRSLPILESNRPRYLTKASKAIKEEFKQKRHLSQKKKATLLRQMLKRFQYGTNAEKEYLHNRIKTQPSKLEKMEAKRQQQQQEKISKKLNQVRKEKIKFINSDAIEQTKKQIARIKNSDLSYFQKFEMLSNISKGFLERYDNGRQYGVQIAAQANLALADLYLMQQL